MRNHFARLVGGPILEAVLWIVRELRALAYADVEGRYYQFKSNPIDILEGPGAERWLSLTSVRRSITGLPAFGVLQRLYPAGVRRGESDRIERIEARALASLLAKAQDLHTRRFLRWLEREVVFPADRKAAMGRE